VNPNIPPAYGDQSSSSQCLFVWGKDHVLPHAKKEGWLDVVLSHAQHSIVGVSDRDHLSCRPMSPPMLDSKIKGVIEVNFRKQG